MAPLGAVRTPTGTTCLAFKSSSVAPRAVFRNSTSRCAGRARFQTLSTAPHARPSGDAGYTRRWQAALRPASAVLSGTTDTSLKIAASAAPVVTPNQEAHDFRNLLCIDLRHKLPDGCILELLEMKPFNSSHSTSKPPILFVHGANHAAWCWQENFLPWFALNGYHVHALSLRGHGSSCDQQADPDKFCQSVQDIAHVVSSLPEPPVLVTHSMGGFFAQRYLIEQNRSKDMPAVAGVAMLASASLTACMPNAQWWRSQKSIMHAIKCMWWMFTSRALHNKSADQEMLFSPDLPDHLMQRYHEELHSKQTSIPVTFKDLKAFLPQVDSAKEAVKKMGLPIAVMIAGNDSLIMQHQVQATADYFAVQPVVLPGVAHDLMLDTRWSTAAQALDDWLQSRFPPVHASSTAHDAISRSE